MTHTTHRNSSTREGGWAIWMPLRTHMNRIQDGGLQSGTDRSEAMAGSLHCLSLCSLGPATTAGILLLSAKKIHGAARGNQEPSGTKHTGQDRTGQPTGFDKPDRTGQPTGTGSPPGLGLEAEASSVHDEESGALARSLSNLLSFRDKEAPDESSCIWPTR